MHINKKSLALMATSAVAIGALAGPVAGASAKTTKITIKSNGPAPKTLADISAPLTSTPFGKGKMTGKVIIPVSYYKWKFKDCTLVTTGEGALVGSKVPKGKWKVTKGKSTGKKCKGATGGGTFSGDAATGKFTWKGTIKT